MAASGRGLSDIELYDGEAAIVMELADIRYHEQLAGRFWAKVDRDSHPHGCWLWTGSLDTQGYGQIGLCTPKGYRPIRAPRVAYILTHGGARDDLDVCHSCDVYYERTDRTYRRCVNPAHLWQGTRRENLADMTRKGRRVTTPHPQPGERNPHAKVTADVVQAIRRRYVQGEHQNVLAQEYGLTPAGVNDIVLRRTWRHLPPDTQLLPRHAGNRALSEQQVREIRVLYAGGERMTQLARAFGVAHSAIHDIVHRATWRHID